MKAITSKAIFIIFLLVTPVSFLYSFFYEQIRIKNNFWDERFFDLSIVLVPIAAIYFLCKKRQLFKGYGILIFAYIIYCIYIFLKETNGAG